jgi:glycosyltransferase involved in cell wall biosynthesis
VLLDALRLVPDRIAGRIAVVLAGRIDPAIRADIEGRERALAAERPDLWLRTEDRWIGNGELTRLVGRCDVVLAPYQRFVGSSGVLMWAARAEKPVLTQDYGLIGRLVQDFSLGLAVDASDARTLAFAMTRMVDRGPHTFFDRRAAATFVAERTPERFADAILAGLVHA